jgi:hypothetical protein
MRFALELSYRERPETAFRVRSNVRAKTGAVVALVHAARTALEGMLRSEART